MNQKESIIRKIKEEYEPRYNRELSDAELEAIYQSLYHYACAVARYERMNHERNGN